MSKGYRLEILKKGHKKTGASRISEEYLEAIYELTTASGGPVRPIDVSRILNVKPSTVNKVIRRLRDMGYIYYEPYRVLTLTKRGEEAVIRLKRRHDSLASTLQHLGMEPVVAEIEAERLEHSLSEESARLFEILGEILSENAELAEQVRRLMKAKQ
ncbi:Transcriptional regulator MntR [archaeon HR01]|nr:Transcriptional regulator MntR [archaeon HR01]